ncbi:hypothetical protein [Paludibaculum fermentans]|uniref:hypothetical protein n=1 Tax=Paludibaculum fermentans TaxID=1473598 RepID=UPI003EBC67DF
MSLEDLTFGQRVERTLKPLGLPIYLCMLGWHYYEHKSIDIFVILFMAVYLFAGVLLDCAMEHLFFMKPKPRTDRNSTP